MKLNLGSGSQPMPGYENLDIANGQSIFPLPYGDGVADEIRASHVLEHFPHVMVFDVIKEWVRVLKVGGALKIAVPDLDYVIGQYQQGLGGPLQKYLMGAQTNQHDFHKSVYTFDSLASALKESGLTNIKPWRSEIQDCAALPVSLNLEGVKKRKMAALWSLPKLGHTDNFKCAASIFPPLDIEMRLGTGVFWEQVLTRMMEQAIADGFEWFFTLDYDTVFTRDHVACMINLMTQTPDADAIFPIQIRREGDTPMFVFKDAKGNQIKEVSNEVFEHPLAEAYSGHFGLTIFRASAFKDLPKPWFKAEPDKDGSWGEGRLDPDIWFWDNFRKAGRKAYLANWVNIGHEQQFATWPGHYSQNWKPFHQYSNDFSKYGCPDNVVADLRRHIG